MKAMHDGEDHHDPALQACKVVPSTRFSGTLSTPKHIRVSSKKTAGTLRSVETGINTKTSSAKQASLSTN
eukprot:scaffold2540_cov153-Pinguiococcus_pyrenoidosus.AAC.1